MWLTPWCVVSGATQGNMVGETSGQGSSPRTDRPAVDVACKDQQQHRIHEMQLFWLMSYRICLKGSNVSRFSGQLSHTSLGRITTRARYIFFAIVGVCHLNAKMNNLGFRFSVAAVSHVIHARWLNIHNYLDTLLEQNRFMSVVSV